MFKKFILVLALFALSNTAFPYARTPRIDIAPGQLCSVTDKDFDHLRYKEEIPYCRRNVSVKTKDKICALYGVYSQEERRKYYTVDHILPLSAGGSNHSMNLWCQHKEIYTGHIETEYYRQLRDGKMRQVEVVHALMALKFNPESPISWGPFPLGQD